MPKKVSKHEVPARPLKDATNTRQIQFPLLTQKEHVECTTILEDQILVLNDILSTEECKLFVKFVDSLPLELTPPKKKGEAERVNYRFAVTSEIFAERLHALISPHLPSFPYPAPVRRKADDGLLRLPHSFNPNIRMYKYTPLQHFGPHYDDSIRDPKTGARSEWTLLIYLTGAEDGVEGGETNFYKNQRGKAQEVITPPLRRGMALLHRHGHDCLLHEGSLVRKGVKYILRSDLMFL